MPKKLVKPNIRKLYKKIPALIIQHKSILLLLLPFLSMDFATRIIGYKISFYHIYSITPVLFTLSWFLLFAGFILCCNSKLGKFLYWIDFFIFWILFLTNSIYYSLTGFFFDFNLLKLTGEGSSYILDTILNTNPLIYLAALLFLILAVIGFRQIPKQKKTNYRILFKIVCLFIIIHAILPTIILGKNTSKLRWNNFEKPRNVYNEFSDHNKCMKLCGLYEYSFRNFYLSFLKPKEAISEEDAEFLSSCYHSEDKKIVNDYTGIFKGKNVIFLQLEGMDKWVFNETDTPNLYSLLDHSLNFTDHYSIYTGGGSTFNSEFAVNTGFTTPVSYNENVYSFNVNTFDYSLARLFKNENYHVNAFHMNTSDFYSRGINYKSWGFDNYFGLLDIKKYTNDDYKLDRELINNPTFYQNMFKQEGNFLDYIITYSPHTPFNTDEGVSKLLLEEQYPDGNLPELTEEECVRLQIKETDKMIGLLIQALKDNNLYDNTVIVAYADHYLYTLKDKTILDQYKNTENNLINNTPFFIWSSDLEKTEIKETTSQLNILPTVLNLFGIDYNSNYYIGKDALSPDYEPYVFFSDYSWYDGNVYIENDTITNDGKISKKELEKKGKLISDVIKKNDLTLKYDYFKTLEKENLEDTSSKGE